MSVIVHYNDGSHRVVRSREDGQSSADSNVIGQREGDATANLARELYVAYRMAHGFSRETSMAGRLPREWLEVAKCAQRTRKSKIGELAYRLHRVYATAIDEGKPADPWEVVAEYVLALPLKPSNS